MLDVDFFKSYNDHYGHSAGDECLTSIGKEISQIFKRSSDFCGRFGGEEFIILSLGLNYNQAKAFAEKTRQAIFDLQLIHSSTHDGFVTASIGWINITNLNHYSPQVTLNLVDKALYIAKANGRNCTSEASSSTQNYTQHLKNL